MAEALNLVRNEDLPPEEQGKKGSQTDHLSGSEKAAIFLLALGEEYGAPIWEKLDDDDVASISIAMSRLGRVTVEMVEELIGMFISQMSMSGALLGTYESTEKLLLQFLNHDRVNSIMEGIRGPAGRNMWEKLSNVQANVLANYLKNEYPQTVAVVLSKIRADHAASVLSILPEELSLEVIQRMLAMDAVQKDILEKIEQTLRSEFISNLSQTRQRDAHEMMAEIFNNFDRQSETRFLNALDDVDREATDKIKALMFTFDDLIKLDQSSAQTLLRSVDKSALALALKGAGDSVRDYFYKNMSERAAKMLQDDLESMGPVRLKDVDEAQTQMINVCKDLAAKGDIVISKGGGGDEIIM